MMYVVWSFSPVTLQLSASPSVKRQPGDKTTNTSPEAKICAL